MKKPQAQKILADAGIVYPDTLHHAIVIRMAEKYKKNTPLVGYHWEYGDKKLVSVKDTKPLADKPPAVKDFPQKKRVKPPLNDTPTEVNNVTIGSLLNEVYVLAKDMNGGDRFISAVQKQYNALIK